MRSTRQKLKLLRGISRANANGGNSLSSRKSGTSNTNGNTSNGNFSNGTLTASSNTSGNLNNHNHFSDLQSGNQTATTAAPPTTVVVTGGRAPTRAGALRTNASFQKKFGTSETASASTSSASTTGTGTGAPGTSTDSSVKGNADLATHDFDQSLSNGSNGTTTGSNGNGTASTSTSTALNIIPNTGHPHHRQWTQFLTANMDCTGLNSDIREKAFGICRDYLHGAWKQIDSKDLVIKRVSGGLSNWLYHCSLPLTLTPQHNEPAQVLLRFYGQVHGEDALESLITESVIFTLLSERKLGPRLYGVFPGGRVEEFIPARPLQTPELRDTELSLLIAQKTAQIHGLNIPISKEPSWLWGTMERWMSNVRECFMKSPAMNDCKPETLQKLMDANLDGELEWLQSFLPKVNSPVVFAHNDLQEGNILIRPEYETADEKLALIDFEYCSYNYRGFDLANHFCEWSYNYNVETYPNFAFTPSDLPTDEEKLRFIRRYISILRDEYRMNFAESDEEFYRTSPLFDETHIMHEVKAFTLASHFFWSLWAIVNAQVSKIPFGYWEYGLCRLHSYFELKKQFVN